MITFSVDANSSGNPFPHYWELCIGSCHAVMGLRSDWREQLEKSHRELGFQYVRFHGLLDDAMNVCARNHNPAEGQSALRYSFFNIDSIFDFLLKIGMKPFIELGFMPSELASGTQSCFYYKANVTPPADYNAWEALIKALTEHLVDRYGLEEVRTWFFEVWNEPNLSYFWGGSQEDYFRLYEHSARAIKSVDNQLRVGGPATSVNSWIPEMLAFCRNAGVPIDFVSTHHYPTDDPLWNTNMTLEEFAKDFAHETGIYERGVLRKMTARSRRQAGDLPLYYTEWNTSAMIPDDIHDEAYSAALVAKTIADNDGLVEGYSFWTFSDLFEEPGQYSTPFHGGFGLQTIHGIPKPTYRIFEMLHALGDQRITVSGGEVGASVEVLAVRDGATLTMMAYNHNIPEADIKTEAVSIALKGVSPHTPVSIARVDHENANPKQKWIDLGSPEYPTPAQLAEIAQASLPTVQEAHLETTEDGASVLNFSLPPHGVVSITLNLAAH